MTVGRLLLLVGCIVFVIAALVGLFHVGSVTLLTLLGLLAAGLACWAASALVP